MRCLQGLILWLFPTLSMGGVPWIYSCAQKGLSQDWRDEQPIEGSVSQALVRCMVNHVMTSPFTAEELQLLPSANISCLPGGFLSKSRTCENLTLDIFEPIRYCIEKDSFPDLSPEYALDFNHTSSPLGQITSYISTRLASSMCALLSSLRSNRGKQCLEQVCRRASHSPSQEPTTQPSIPPSSSPTSVPTVSPSGLSSQTPSMFPSTVLSEGPSRRPSKSPSSRPTREATEAPSNDPTGEALPSSASFSSLPSWYPTPAPTAKQTWGPGPVLQVRVTLRVLLDGVQPDKVPFPDPANDALEQALIDSLKSVQGFQTVEIVGASKAPTPEHAPIVLTFLIAASRPCGDEVQVQMIACADPEAATNIAWEFRDAFIKALETGAFATDVQRQASRQNVTIFRDFSLRSNSSNLMSSNSFLTAANQEEPIPSSSDAVRPICFCGIFLGATFFQFLA